MILSGFNHKLKAALSFKELSNGFASCDDPAALQQICDRLGPGQIRVFTERWWARLPLPFTRADRRARLLGEPHRIPVEPFPFVVGRAELVHHLRQLFFRQPGQAFPAASTQPSPRLRARSLQKYGERRSVHTGTGALSPKPRHFVETGLG